MSASHASFLTKRQAHRAVIQLNKLRCLITNISDTTTKMTVRKSVAKLMRIFVN